MVPLRVGEGPFFGDVSRSGSTDRLVSPQSPASCSAARCLTSNCRRKRPWLPAWTTPVTLPSERCTRNARSLPVRDAAAPVPVTAPRPKNALTAVPLVGVHVHVLPVSVALAVSAAFVPVSLTAAVAGMHFSEPRMPVRVVAFAASFVMVTAKVPVRSVLLREIEPEAVAVAPANEVPVPVTFASRA
jgi:hypothetical protein